jgi:uncharacterized protein YacL (UPF0231 family)
VEKVYIKEEKMSLCGICKSRIDDGEPYDEEHLAYCGCEENYDVS